VTGELRKIVYSTAGMAIAPGRYVLHLNERA